MEPEQDHEVPDDESLCASCAVELYGHERERGMVVCVHCSEKLEREMTAYIAFIRECRAQG